MNSCEPVPPIIPESASMGTALDPAAGKYPQIGVKYLWVIGVQVVKVAVKAVSVFHEKFANPEQTCAWAGLIANLGLNLVEHNRKVAVGAHELLCYIGYDFLVSHGQNEFAVPCGP